MKTLTTVLLALAFLAALAGVVTWGLVGLGGVIGAVVGIACAVLVVGVWWQLLRPSALPPTVPPVVAIAFREFTLFAGAAGFFFSGMVAAAAVTLGLAIVASGLSFVWPPTAKPA